MEGLKGGAGGRDAFRGMLPNKLLPGLTQKEEKQAHILLNTLA